MTSKRKARIGVIIDGEIADRLYWYIAKKYTRWHGKLSETIEEAIKEYLDKREKNQG